MLIQHVQINNVAPLVNKYMMQIYWFREQNKIFNFGMMSKPDTNLYGICSFTYVVKLRQISIFTSAAGANMNKLNGNLQFCIVVNLFN